MRSEPGGLWFTQALALSITFLPEILLLTNIVIDIPLRYALGATEDIRLVIWALRQQCFGRMPSNPLQRRRLLHLEPKDVRRRFRNPGRRPTGYLIARSTSSGGTQGVLCSRKVRPGRRTLPLAAVGLHLYIRRQLLACMADDFL